MSNTFNVKELRRELNRFFIGAVRRKKRFTVRPNIEKDKKTLEEALRVLGYDVNDHDKFKDVSALTLFVAEFDAYLCFLSDMDDGRYGYYVLNVMEHYFGGGKIMDLLEYRNEETGLLAWKWDFKDPTTDDVSTQTHPEVVDLTADICADDFYYDDCFFDEDEEYEPYYSHRYSYYH